jgi:hypothetical protein
MSTPILNYVITKLGIEVKKNPELFCKFSELLDLDFIVKTPWICQDFTSLKRT